jgi:hypothetical protein
MRFRERPHGWVTAEAVADKTACRLAGLSAAYRIYHGNRGGRAERKPNLEFSAIVAQPGLSSADRIDLPGWRASPQTPGYAIF